MNKNIAARDMVDLAESMLELLTDESVIETAAVVGLQHPLDGVRIAAKKLLNSAQYAAAVNPIEPESSGAVH